MNSREAYATLSKLGVPVIRTSDAAAALRVSTTAASKILTQLAGAGLASALRPGAFWLNGEVDPYRLPEYLTAPFESYVSLHTALHLRGMLEQIPEVIYAASLSRTQRVQTRVAAFSFHHIAPEVFGGYEVMPSGAKLATPEKALFDFAYLSAGRSRLFHALPELELPRGFRRSELKRWLAKIPAQRSRTITERKLAEFLAAAVG